MSEAHHQSEQTAEPTHPWLLAEAAGNEQLLEMIVTREALFDAVNASRTDPASEPEASRERRAISQLNAEIDDYKFTNKVYPYDEGPIRRISKLI